MGRGIGCEFKLWLVLVLSGAVLAASTFNSTLVFAQDEVIESDLGTFEVDVPEAVVEANSIHNELKIVTPKGAEHIFSLLPPTENAIDIYSIMSPEDQMKFQESRLFFLSKAAIVLEKSELPIGFGSLIRQKLIYLFKKKDRDNKPLSFSKSRTKGQEVVSQVLQEIDQKLWSQAPIVAQQNEFAISVGIGVSGIAGYQRKVVGGSAGIGFNIGMNRQEKAFVFEIATEIEKVEVAITPTFMFGLAPKIGFLLKKQDRGSEMIMREGHTLYPPMVPGYVATSSQMVNMGFNSALLSFPPLIGDAFSYLNQTWRFPLFRIVVSPLLRGIIRLQFPGVTKDGPLIQKINNMIFEVTSRYKNRIKSKIKMATDAVVPLDEDVVDQSKDCEILLMPPPFALLIPNEAMLKDVV